MTINNIGNRAHVLNHSHIRCVVGAFDKILHGVSIWNRTKAVLYFILKNQNLFTLYIMI